MQYYETMMVLTTKLDEEQTNSTVEKFTSLISENGTVISTDVWGKRRLAYEIDHQTEGYYVLITFSCESDFLAELDRIYNITDSVLRSIIVRLEELPAKPAAKPEEPAPVADADEAVAEAAPAAAEEPAAPAEKTEE